MTSNNPEHLSLMLDFVRTPAVFSDLLNIVSHKKSFPPDGFHPFDWDLPSVCPTNVLLNNTPMSLDDHVVEMTNDQFLVSIVVGAEELIDRSTFTMMQKLSDRTYENQMMKIVWKTRPDVDLLSYLSVYEAAVDSGQLLPFLSFIFYFGEKPWDGPTSLFESVDDPLLLALYEKLYKDFRPTIISLSSLGEEDLALTESDLWAVAAAAKYRGDPAGLAAFVQAHGKDRKPLNPGTLTVIREVFGIPEFPAP